jgi:hypothetical protein
VAHECGEAHVPVGVVSGGRRPARRGRVAVAVPEHGLREAHRHGPVGERVVDAPDESGSPARASNHVEVPERPRSIQPLGEQPRDLGPQRSVVAGVDARSGHVGRDVEAFVVDPDRLLRGSPQPAREGRDRWQPPLDRGRQLLGAGRARPDQHDLAGVPGDRVGLERQDRPILVREGDALHVSTIEAVNGCCR